MRPFFDAHNHLQDPRLAPFLDEIVSTMQDAGIERCVVNGTCEEDWPHVAALAERFPGFVQPSFGLHPWKAESRSPHWQDALTGYLSRFPDACLGECGLDRWKKPFDFSAQKEVFLAQVDLAAARDLPLSLHCLNAWGPLRDCLVSRPRPERGFLLHSYGGSREMVPEFSSLGAYFSFSGYFLHSRKGAVREAFRDVPPERLLVETDAPDMLPPAESIIHPLATTDGTPLNHPANLPGIVTGLASLRGLAPGLLSAQLADNFRQFFGVSSET